MEWGVDRRHTGLVPAQWISPVSVTLLQRYHTLLLSPAPPPKAHILLSFSTSPSVAGSGSLAAQSGLYRWLAEKKLKPFQVLWVREKRRMKEITDVKKRIPNKYWLSPRYLPAVSSSHPGQCPHGCGWYGWCGQVGHWHVEDWQKSRLGCLAGPQVPSATKGTCSCTARARWPLWHGRTGPGRLQHQHLPTPLLPPELVPEKAGGDTCPPLGWTAPGLKATDTENEADKKQRAWDVLGVEGLFQKAKIKHTKAINVTVVCLFITFSLCRSHGVVDRVRVVLV